MASGEQMPLFHQPPVLVRDPAPSDEEGPRRRRPRGPSPQAQLIDKSEIEKPPRIELYYAVAEMLEAGGFARVEPIKWDVWFPCSADDAFGDRHALARLQRTKKGGHVGKRTMRRLQRREWVEVTKGVAALTARGLREAERFIAKGCNR